MLFVLRLSLHSQLSQLVTELPAPSKKSLKISLDTQCRTVVYWLYLREGSLRVRVFQREPAPSGLKSQRREAEPLPSTSVNSFPGWYGEFLRRSSTEQPVSGRICRKSGFFDVLKRNYPI